MKIMIDDTYSIEDTMSDIFEKYGVKVSLKKPDSFAIAVETLTRIGIPSKGNRLIQTCHILHKGGEYSILHFKELFQIDGKQSTLDLEDIQRRNRIISLLVQWGIVDVIDESQMKDGVSSMNSVKVVSHKDKDNWVLDKKYTIGINHHTS